jgi:deoxyribodipyrimidine photo-lyase
MAVPSDPPPVILWFRRDLRLADNLALQAAIKTGASVVCIYVREPERPFAGALGAAQGWWLHHSLTALNQSLESAGNRLLLLSGKPIDIIEGLVEKTGAKAVFWNRLYDAGGIERDSKIKSRLRDGGIDVQSFAGFLMHEPTRLLTGQGGHYKVFTPFWKAFEAGFSPHDPLSAPKSIRAPEHFPAHEALEQWHLTPHRPNWAKDFPDHWRPGEAGALARLKQFLDGRLSGYREDRDLPGKSSTSGLSPHLAMGEISPHRIWSATGTAFDTHPADAVAFRRELVWREFSWHLLFHKPDMPTTNMDRRFDAFEWRDDRKELRAWQRGETGYPIVDAGMRELWQTGFMQNRVRMIVASFLIKDLLIDWREGERWFRDTLVDIDCANNAMNWQWVAGCGPDASPWFRIFNPVKQGETFDAEGDYVRRYCSELPNLPRKYIHCPFDAPSTVLKEAGLTLGETYPRPLVEHAHARERALAVFKALPKV